MAQSISSVLAVRINLVTNSLDPLFAIFRSEEILERGLVYAGGLHRIFGTEEFRDFARKFLIIVVKRFPSVYAENLIILAGKTSQVPLTIIKLVCITPPLILFEMKPEVGIAPNFVTSGMSVACSFL